VYPKDVSGYTIVSNDTAFVGTMAALFDGGLTASTGYVKPTCVPWNWVVDMKEARTFTGFYMHVWETFFYGSPTSVTIYGSTAGTGPWTQIGTQSFSVDYQEATVALVY
jgi:hypothetical protein